MTTTQTLSEIEVPIGVGPVSEMKLPATRSYQGGRTHYEITTSVFGMLALVDKPDPTRPIPEDPDNRVVQEGRARQFGEYLISNKDWICPPLVERIDPGECRFEVVAEFPDGTAWGWLSVPMNIAKRIIDGQHRALGTFIGQEVLQNQVSHYRQLVAMAQRNGEDPATVAAHQRELDKWLEIRDRLSGEHLSLTLVETDQHGHRQIFVDVNRNAKGVNPDLTAVLDTRSVVNRIAHELFEHPLLKGRVETGAKARISRNNSNFVGANTVAELTHAVLVGRGRMSKAREAKFAADESLCTRQVWEFLDAITAAFEPLRQLADEKVTAPYLRSVSLLGSQTMLRVLGIVWHDLREGDPDNGVSRWGQGEIEAYFKKLEPHMELDEWEVDGMKERGIAPSNTLWMDTGAFVPEGKAPHARGGSLGSLADVMVGWARDGMPDGK